MFAGIFPVDSNDFPKLEESIKRVRLVSFLVVGDGSRLILTAAHVDGPQRHCSERIVDGSRTGLSSRISGDAAHGCVPTTA